MMMMTYQITHAVPDLQLEVAHNFYTHNMHDTYNDSC